MDYRPCPTCDGQTGDVDDCEICEGTGWTTVRAIRDVPR
jgi:DnaJ-class molecular chaperone